MLSRKYGINVQIGIPVFMDDIATIQRFEELKRGTRNCARSGKDV